MSVVEPSTPLPPPGAKHDAGKARYDLIPPEPLDLIARALAYGAEEYSADGWRLVPDWRRRYFSAMMRHTWAWYRGEEFDPESGLPHLAHAACSLLFLMGKEAEPVAPLIPCPGCGKTNVDIVGIEIIDGSWRCPRCSYRWER